MPFRAIASYPVSLTYPAAAHFPASATYPITPWTPVQFPGLLAYYNGDIGGVYTDTGCTALATAGQSVQGCKSLYGTSNNATQGTGALEPLAAAGGLKVDTSATQLLVPTTPIFLNPAVGYTAYCVVNFIGDVACYGSNAITSASVGTTANGAIAQFINDDNSTQLTIFPSSLAGPTLFAIYCDASGNATFNCTNSGGAVTGTDAIGVTINALALCANFSNADADNQYPLWMFGGYAEPGGSADLSALAWILAKTGASL